MIEGEHASNFYSSVNKIKKISNSDELKISIIISSVSLKYPKCSGL